MKEKINIYILIFTKWLFISIGLVGASIIFMFLSVYSLDHLINIGVKNALMYDEKITDKDLIKALLIGFGLVITSVLTNIYIYKKKTLDYFSL